MGENLIISSSYFLLPLLPLLTIIISFSLLTPITSGDEFIDNDTLVAIRCNKSSDSKVVSENYTRNVDYVVAHISNPSVDDHGGFKNATYSNGSSTDDIVYSLVQCRGDLTDANCSTCLSNIASINMSTGCLGDKNTNGAVVLREKCSFKYSDQDFFGQLDDINYLYRNFSPFCSGVNNTWDAAAVVKPLLDSLVENSINATSTMFAKGSNKTSDGSHAVEAMAECRGDLHLDDCKNCLNNAATNLVGHCSNQTAGNYFLGASCNLRFAWNIIN